MNFYYSKRPGNSGPETYNKCWCQKENLNVVLSDGDVIIQVYILNEVEQFNTFFHWALERFPS